MSKWKSGLSVCRDSSVLYPTDRDVAKRLRGGINVPCSAPIKPHLDLVQLGALQHRHTPHTRGPEGTGLEQLPWGGKLQEQGWLPWGQRHLGAPCSPSGHSEEVTAACMWWGPETTEGNWNEGDSEWNSEIFFPPEEGEAVAHVALRGCAGFIHGGFQGLSSLVWPCICPSVSRRFS